MLGWRTAHRDYARAALRELSGKMTVLGGFGLKVVAKRPLAARGVKLIAESA